MSEYLVNVTSGDDVEQQKFRQVFINAENADEANCLVEAQIQPYEWVDREESVKVCNGSH